MNRYHLALLIASFSALKGFDQPHFFRASNFFHEPRLERDYMSSVDAYFQAGSTNKARNLNHDTVPLFDLYGRHNMHELGIGVPGKDLSNELDLILQQLSLVPSRCVTSDDSCKKTYEFATYSICGNFSTYEGILTFAQNLKKGFFFRLYIPFQRMKVDDILFCDKSPQDDICPNSMTPIWELFKDNFDAILARYCLSANPYNKTSIGDISLTLGWTHSFQKTEVLDFVDTSIQFGVLIPSGEERCEDEVFSLPFGYNGHTGAIIEAKFAMGMLNWLNIGADFNVLVFGNKTKCIRLKTGEYQSGIIKLAKGNAQVELGTMWQVGSYLKFDHFLGGLSLLFGYSYVSSARSEITPCDVEKFNVGIANSDESLFSWNMHTLNFMLEYDFSKEYCVVGPRISAYYNYIAGGKRIFLTNMGGGNFGIDFAWDI